MDSFYIDRDKSIPNLTVVKRVGNSKAVGYKDHTARIAMEECFFITSNHNYAEIILVLANVVNRGGVNNPAEWDALNRALDDFTFPSFFSTDSLITDSALDTSALPDTSGAITICGRFLNQDGRVIRKTIGWAINGDGAPATESAKFLAGLLYKARDIRAVAASYDVIEINGTKVIIDAGTKLPPGDWECVVNAYTDVSDIVDLKTGRRLANVISQAKSWEQAQVPLNHDLGGYLDYRAHRLPKVDQRREFVICVTKEEFAALKNKYQDVGRAVVEALL